MATWLGGTDERPARFFSTPEDFREWLEEHHATETELWTGLFKKHAADRGITWDQALQEALCFGWIDSISYWLDDDTSRQRWTPRKPGSNWSPTNIAHVQRLIAEGRMHPSGLDAFSRWRPDRNPDEQEAEPELTPGWEAELRADPSAAAFFFDRATPSYRRTCVAWVMGAKQEATRRRRMTELIADSAAGLLIKPQRYGEPPAWARNSD